MNKQMKPAVLGGIVKQNGTMHGFRTGFKTAAEANKYKEMFKFILDSDDYNVDYQTAAYDKRGVK